MNIINRHWWQWLMNEPYIHEFNIVETLSQLGSNVSDLSKPILMEIGKAIGAYDRQIAQNREETRVDRTYRHP